MMLMRRSVPALLILLFLADSLSAQTQISISGKILSAGNNPVAGATVALKGSKKSAVAGVDGSFSISLNAPSAGGKNIVLVVSAIGYGTTETSLPPASTSTLNITLKESPSNLNEVVVIGYGTQRKRDLTGAVGSVQLANVDKTPVFGTSQLLEGTVAGVQVTQTNSQPGSSFTIRIRGTSSISSSSDPLIVVDGYPGPDISLNANDIASMEVLKDASATAIYGSRGANGVVMITTRKGIAGKSAVTFDMYTGVQQVAKTLKLMDAKQFATYLDQVTAYANANNPTQIALPFSQAGIDSLGVGTNWQKAIFRNAPVSNATLSFRGGSENSLYYLSVNYFDQQGIVLNSDFKRGVVRFNLDNKVSDKINFGLRSQASYDLQDLSNVNTNGGSSGGTILDALRESPTIPIYDSTGAFTFQNGPKGYTDILGNPVAAAMLNTDKVNNIRLFTNLFGEYEIIKGLKFRTSIGGELRNTREDIFKPTTTFLGASTGGLAAVNTNNNYDWVTENTLTYDKKLGSIHAITVLAGWAYQEWKYRSANTTAQTLSSNSYGTDNLGVGAGIASTSNTSKNALASGLGRINYRLMDKYLFTVTMRADGSSRFGANKKWGYFPSGAFAWRLSDEKFIQTVTAITDLKLRTSYGVAGNQEIGSYNSLTQYGTNAYGLDGTRVVGISPNNIANADLGWESTASFDAGIDLGLIKNRITFTADYYNKKTTNLLYNVTLPSTSGFTTMLQNIGSMRNQGFEFLLSTVNIDTKKLHWGTTFNFSRNINKILSLGAVSYQFTGNVSTSLFPSGGQNSSILQVGQPIGSFYGYVFNGIWQTQADITKSGTKQAVKPGDPIYKDLNGDSAITAQGDKKIIGHALPKFTYGFTSDLYYGRFNLYILIQGVYGDNILNENRIETENGTTSDNKFAYVATKSWTGPGTSNTLASVGSTERRGLGVTSDIIEDGTYMRFKTMTLSYDLPLPKLTKVFKKASLYVTVNNLITITHYSGFDPEVNSYPNTSGNYTSLNTDYNPYPNVKTYIAGVKFEF